MPRSACHPDWRDLESRAVLPFSSYCRLLFDYNEHTNLVSRAQPETVIKDHIIDSLTLVRFVNDYRARRGRENQLSLIDVGSGAGLPGLILAIALPLLQVTLVESTVKKYISWNWLSSRWGLASRLQL